MLRVSCLFILLSLLPACRKKGPESIWTIRDVPQPDTSLKMVKSITFLERNNSFAKLELSFVEREIAIINRINKKLESEVTFDSNGVKRMGKRKNEKPFGFYKFFDRDGNIQELRWFHNGEIVGELTFGADPDYVGSLLFEEYIDTNLITTPKVKVHKSYYGDSLDLFEIYTDSYPVMFMSFITPYGSFQDSETDLRTNRVLIKIDRRKNRGKVFLEFGYRTKDGPGEYIKKTRWLEH